MFKGLADFVVHRYKLIILVWIIALFYAFPLTFEIGDVVVYTEGDSDIEGLEAIDAQEIIDESFAGQIPPSTLMIVIQNSDVLSIEARDYSTALHDSILADPRIQGVEGVSCLYSELEAYYMQIALQTAPASHVLYDQTNQTAQMVYGVPLSIAQNHMYLLSASGGTLNDSQVQDMVLSQLNLSLVQQGLSPDMVNSTMAYAQSFYGVWLATHTLEQSVLQEQIGSVAFAFFSPLGDVGAFAVAIAQSFTTYTYDNSSSIWQFAIWTLSVQSGLDSGLILQITNLGPAPTLAEAAELGRTIVYSPFLSIREMPNVPSFLLGNFVNIRPNEGQPNTTMLMVVPMSVAGSSEEAVNDVSVIREIVAENSELIGQDYEVYVTGDPALNVDMMDTVEKDTAILEPVTIILVVVLVGAYFRSAVSPWIPLMTVGMAYLLSMALVFIIGSYILEIHFSVLTLVLTVMLGAGTDYCIFIMSRYREERIQGKPKEEAVRTSLTWAGESIATSGATVMIGFGVLMIGQYGMVRSMGMALAISVGIALLFALTMLPSLVMLVGDRVFWPVKMSGEAKRAERRESRGGGYFRKSAKFSLKHAKGIVIAAVIISIPAIYLVSTLETSYDFLAGMPEVESTEGLSALQDGFGAGKILPTYIVVQFDREVIANGSLDPVAADSLENYCVLVNDTENVQTVSGPTRPFGNNVNDSYLNSLPLLERAEYEAAISMTIAPDSRTILLTVVLQDEPFTITSIDTIEVIREIDETPGILPSGTAVYVGGTTAGMADVSGSVSGDFSVMRIVAILGIFLVLMVVLGSLLIPVRLILTVLLNVSWTIAATIIVFQTVEGIPVLWLMPLILFVVAMGLGMDYDIFLTTRIREEVIKGKDDEQAIVTAVERTGAIITACGMVMAGAFGSMMLAETALLQQFGFALAFAILLDTLLIRIYIVPAVMLLLKKWNWYAPGRLQRVRRGEQARKD